MARPHNIPTSGSVAKHFSSGRKLLTRVPSRSPPFAFYCVLIASDHIVFRFSTFVMFYVLHCGACECVLFHIVAFLWMCVVRSRYLVRRLYATPFWRHMRRSRRDHGLWFPAVSTLIVCTSHSPPFLQSSDEYSQLCFLLFCPKHYGCLFF